MRAAVVTAWGAPLAVQDIEAPRPGPGEVLARIRVSGVCHSDVHQWKGDWPAERALMESLGIRVLGHEGVGTVEAVGPGVTRFSVGDRVGVPWMNSWCGGCEVCLTGYSQWCAKAQTTSVTVNGTFAELATVSERAAVSIPAAIPDDEAAPLMCAGVTAYGAVRRLVSELRIPPGKIVAVVGGAGGLGHYAIQIAGALGYRVAGIDVGENRVRFIRELGAEWAFDASEAEAAMAALGGADASLVFTPKLTGYELALKLTRLVGGMVAVGIPDPAEGSLPITPASLIARGTRIVPANVGVTHEFDELFRLYGAGQVKGHLARRGTLSDLSTILQEMADAKYLARAVVSI
ncbi:MAG: alcohol dehydrogenase catalytic domain-containing protein [Thermoplasmata archaeon]|nr:alcohol dehydrogenase catalytic domain-containing protein [Thermoplasmata archaeon]